MCNLCVLVQHLVIIMEPEDNAARQSYSRGDFANKLTLLDYYVMYLVSCDSSLPLNCKIRWDRNTERKTAYCQQSIPTTCGALRSHAMGAGRCYPMCLTKSISFALSAANCAFHKTDVWKCSPSEDYCVAGLIPNNRDFHWALVRPRQCVKHFTPWRIGSIIFITDEAVEA